MCTSSQYPHVGRVYRRVYRVGMGPGGVGGGVYRVPSTVLEEVPSTAKRAPEDPAGVWSGWYWGPGILVFGGWDGS